MWPLSNAIRSIFNVWYIYNIYISFVPSASMVSALCAVCVSARVFSWFHSHLACGMQLLSWCVCCTWYEKGTNAIWKSISTIKIYVEHVISWHVIPTVYVCVSACSHPSTMGKLNCFTNEFIHCRRTRSFCDNHHNTFISSNILMCLCEKCEILRVRCDAETASTQTNFKRNKIVWFWSCALVSYSYKNEGEKLLTLFKRHFFALVNSVLYRRYTYIFNIA